MGSMVLDEEEAIHRVHHLILGLNRTWHMLYRKALGSRTCHGILGASLCTLSFQNGVVSGVGGFGRSAQNLCRSSISEMIRSVYTYVSCFCE